MLNGTTRSFNPYTNYSYYQIEEIAIDNWEDFTKLLEVHSKGLNSRRKPFAKKLRGQVEEMLRWLAYCDWDNFSALQGKYVELLFEDTEFAINLREELEVRLEEIRPTYFRFPSTEIGLGVGRLDTSNWKKRNLLSLVGYETGNKALSKGISRKFRRALLDEIYLSDIPLNVIDFVEDIEEWGHPHTDTRLKKMAYSIAAIVKCEKGSRSKDYEQSVADRELDLKYLKKKYYTGVYDFKYPTT